MPVLAALRKYLLHYLEKGRSAEMKERKKLSRLKNLLEEAGGYDFTVFETHAESAVVRKKSGGHTERLYETLKKILEECSYRISFALLSEKLRDAQTLQCGGCSVAFVAGSSLPQSVGRAARKYRIYSPFD